jgi:hypothetical protein
MKIILNEKKWKDTQTMAFCFGSSSAICKRANRPSVTKTTEGYHDFGKPFDAHHPSHRQLWGVLISRSEANWSSRLLNGLWPVLDEYFICMSKQEHLIRPLPVITIPFSGVKVAIFTTDMNWLICKLFCKNV